MKTRSKALLLTLCAVLLVAASVLGTMAYLTASDEVTNTFTVGSVGLTLDEAHVYQDGTVIPNVDRVRQNSYKLMPGHEYTKDPTVHVARNSENSWIFVKVENGISAYEAANSTEEGGYKTIAEQIKAYGWTALAGVDNVYYKVYDKDTVENDLPVFSKFKIADDAEKTTGWGSFTDTKVTVTAYAVQKDGFDTAAAAWNATFGKTPATTEP